MPEHNDTPAQPSKLRPGQRQLCGKIIGEEFPPRRCTRNKGHQDGCHPLPDSAPAIPASRAPAAETLEQACDKSGSSWWLRGVPGWKVTAAAPADVCRPCLSRCAEIEASQTESAREMVENGGHFQGCEHYQGSSRKDKPVTVFVGKDGIEYETAEDKWLSEAVVKGNGAVTFSYTDGGDIGVFLPNQEKAAGVGDTVMGAVNDAIRRQS